jgi:hypothetical protein
VVTTPLKICSPASNPHRIFVPTINRGIFGLARVICDASGDVDGSEAATFEGDRYVASGKQKNPNNYTDK